MVNEKRQRWLPYFRQAMRHLGPHRRTLLIGLVAAIGVSVFYTFSVSSIIPTLKIIFAEHETFVDWLHRVETERRLGVTLRPDMPDDPDGLLIVSVRDTSPVTDTLEAGDRIMSIDSDQLSSYEVERTIARHDDLALSRVYVQREGQVQTVDLTLRPHAWWWPIGRSLAAVMPRDPSPAGRYRTLLVVMIAVVVAGVLGGICRFLNEGLVATAVQRAMHDVRTDLARHAMQLPLNWHSSQPAGDTLARFSNDIAKVQVGIETLFGKVVREPLKAVGVLALTIALDWRMLLIAIVGLPLGVIAIRTFGRLVKRAQKRASQSWGRLLDHLGERLTGIRVVKAASMEQRESQNFAQEDQELTRAQTHIALVDAGSKPVLEVLATLAISAFILYGGYRVFHGHLEPHLFFGAVICLGGVFDPLRKMSNVNNRLQAAEASARRIFEVMSIPTEEPQAPTAPTIELPPFRRQIEFRGVTFAYPSNPQRPVLSDISFTVDKGEVIALVGGNGSGKTTLMSLLLRFFEPDRGQILIDGQDIAGVSLASLRRQLGLVTQEAIIFSDTVRGNIAYGANGVADADIRRAAQLAHVDDFISTLRVDHNGHTTTGYDARVSFRTLSGGQRQRIVLARAILRDPPILILDEATSQVDTESEVKIQQALDDVTRDRTTFIIAHRYSTIARANRIVVLDNGRMVGLGTHDELRESCPFYVNLVKTQYAHGAAS